MTDSDLRTIAEIAMNPYLQGAILGGNIGLAKKILETPNCGKVELTEEELKLLTHPTGGLHDNGGNQHMKWIHT